MSGRHIQRRAWHSEVGEYLRPNAEFYSWQYELCTTVCGQDLGNSKSCTVGQNQTRSRDMVRGSVCLPRGFMPQALVVNAYWRIGRGEQLTSVYTCRMFILAAVMYVDDIDLLHWAKFPTTSATELVQQVLAAMNDWGLLGQATDGALKPKKCVCTFSTTPLIMDGHT